MLTEEFIEGTRFRDIRPLSLTPSERRRVATMGADAIFRMAFEDGFFHGDPHPSNLLLTPSGDLALLDFGMVGYMSQGDIEALSRLFIAVIQRDASAALRGLERLGVGYATEIRGDLVRDLREFLNKYSGLSVGEVTLGQALSELIALARRYRLRMPPVFPLLTKALVTAEGLARSIDPTINVYEVARPYAQRLLYERYRPRNVVEVVEERALEYARYAEEMPDQISLILTEFADGEIEVQLEHGGLDELFGRWTCSPTGSSSPRIFAYGDAADMALDEGDVDPEFIASSRALLVTGTPLSRPGSRSASFKAVRAAREAGTRVLFDLDYRPVFWGVASHEQGGQMFVESTKVTEGYRSVLPQCDLVVGTEEEIRIAGGFHRHPRVAPAPSASSPARRSCSR